MSGAIADVPASLAKVGFTARGSYGEGSEALGCIYQISNDITLGISEEDIERELLSVTNRIAAIERKTAAALLSSKGAALENDIMRSFGILKYARLIESREALPLIAKTVLGVRLGLIQGIEPGVLYKLAADIMPAMLAREQNRDAARAALIGQALVSADAAGE